MEAAAGRSPCFPAAPVTAHFELEGSVSARSHSCCSGELNVRIVGRVGGGVPPPADQFPSDRLHAGKLRVAGGRLCKRTESRRRQKALGSSNFIPALVG